MFARDFRKQARLALSGKWAISILVTLLASFLGGSISYTLTLSASSGGSVYHGIWGDPSYTHTAGWHGRIPVFWVYIAGTVLTIIAVYTLLRFLLGGAVDLGLARYNTRLLMREEQSPLGTLFSRFHIFLKALGLRIVKAVFVFLWALLFIVPGIVAAYRYSMADYLMAQHPEMGIMEAIAQSKVLMDGHKGRLFCLHLSFIGWFFLCILSAGIGFLWLNPYRAAAEAAFYLQVSGQAVPLGEE